MALQIRRGLESARASITPAEGEVLYVTDTKRMYIGDGSTLGGNQVGGNLLFPTIDNIKLGYATTATAAGTTTLTATSGYRQLFTGSANQTIVLPVTSTLALGVSYEIENNSTGTLTVQSSGLNAIGTIPPGVTAHLLCVSTSLTTAAAWDMDYISFATLTGTGNNVLATAPTISGLVLTGTLTANGGVGTSGQVLQSTGSGVQWAAVSSSVTAGSGISVSGSTVSLATSGVSSGQYGSSSFVPQFSVDAYGRITSITEQPISGGGGGGSSFTNIYAGAGGTVISPTVGSSTLVSADQSGDYLYLIAGSNVTITGSTGSQNAIMISATGGGSSGGGLTWSTTTMSSYQGSTTITYPTGVAATGNRAYIAFFGSGISTSWIGSTPMDPNLSWSMAISMNNWVVYSAMTSSSSPSSQTWNFMNNGHMLYTSWVVTGTTMSGMSMSNSSSSTSWIENISSMNNKTDTVLYGSTNSSLDMTTASISAPSGYTSTGTKKHPLDSQLSVASFQNPSPTTMTSLNWGVASNYYTYYYAYINAGG